MTVRRNPAAKDAASPLPFSLLQVITTSDRRGAEQFAFDLFESLRDRGWSTEICALTAGLNDNPLDVQVLGKRSLAPATLAGLRRRATKEHRLVIAHGSRTLAACGIALAGRKGRFVYRNIGNPEDWLTTPLRRLRTRAFLTQASGVAALWPASARVFESQLGVPADRICVIGNGRRSADYPVVSEPERMKQRLRLGLRPRDVVVAGIGALSPEKGFDDAIRVMETLPADHVLVLAGDGPERASLELLANAAVGDRARFLGVTPSSRDALAVADVVLVPSRTEGLSGVAIEAGMTGLPVVITDVGGSRQIVLDGRTGRVVPRGDAAAMREAIRDCVQRQASLGRAARDHCLAEFELSVVVDRWEEFLRLFPAAHLPNGAEHA